MVSVNYKLKDALVGHVMIEVDRNPMAMVHVIARTHGVEFRLQLGGYVGRRLEIAEVERLYVDKAKPLVANGEYQQIAVVFIRCIGERHFFCYALQ